VWGATDVARAGQKAMMLVINPRYRPSENTLEKLNWRK
jgi:hypothetical protein